MNLKDIKERAEKYWSEYFSGERTDDLHGELAYMRYPSLDGVVLDLGCGDLSCITNLTANNNAYIIGADIAETPLMYAKKKLAGRKNIDLIQAAAQYLPFPDNSFDKTFLVEVIENNGRNYEKMWEEAARVSKKIVASFWHKDFVERNPEWTVKKISDCVYDSPNWWHECAYFTEEEVKNMFDRLGFDAETKVYTCKQCFVVPINQPWPYYQLPKPETKTAIEVEAVKRKI